MLALRGEPVGQALFLSPVVDMAGIICNLMTRFGVTEERLRREREIPTPVRPLSWDYYRYALEHPVVWNKLAAILYGERDTLCEFEAVSAFATASGAGLTVLEGGEHFFHTREQLACFRNWLRGKIAG